jgi:hypothetical protein
MDSERKEEATLRAGVALWGGTLYRSDADNGAPMWVISRWAMAAFRLELDRKTVRSSRLAQHGFVLAA